MFNFGGRRVFKTLLTLFPGCLQVAKPNKYPACAEVHEKYFQCALVTEASFGKFINRCNELKEKLDECNIREQVPTQGHANAALRSDTRACVSSGRCRLPSWKEMCVCARVHVLILVCGAI